MTVPTQVTRNDAIAIAGQVAYDFGFEALTDADLQVYVNGLPESGGYTIARNIAPQIGGTVTFFAPYIPTAGQNVSLVLEMPLDRTTDYQNSGDFLASAVNADFDKIYIGAIQNENFLDRTLRLQNVDPTPSNGEEYPMALPLLDARKDRLLVFNNIGVPIAGPKTSDITDGLSLKTTLTNGNVTGGTDIDISVGDSITTLNSGIKINRFYNEGDFASNSATGLATQQSIKTYVDSAVGLFDTLSEVLANGNSSGGSDISMSSGDNIIFAGSIGELKIGSDPRINIGANGVDLFGAVFLKSQIGQPNSTLGFSQGAAVNEFSIDGTLSGNSDTSLPTEKAVKTYVDSAVGLFDTLAEVLANGNVSGGNDISMTSGDDITFAGTTGQIKHGADPRIKVDTNGVDLLGKVSIVGLAGQPAPTLGFEYTAGAGQIINEFSIDGTLAGNSDSAIPTEKAVKTYVDNSVPAAETLANTLVAGNVTSGTDIKVSTSDAVQFGTSVSNNLKISHDGTVGLIKEIGSGYLKIQGDQLDIRGNDGTSGITISPVPSQTYNDITFQTGPTGSVQLYVTADGVAFSTGQAVQSIQTSTSLSTSNTTLSTTGAIKSYVDSQVGSADTLKEVLVNGNVTDGSNLVISSGDAISIGGQNSTNTVTTIDGSSTNTDLATALAIKTYVDSSVPAAESLKNTLAAGNVTDGTNIEISSGDDLVFAGTSGQIKLATNPRIDMDTAGIDLFGAVLLKSQAGQPSSTLAFSQGATINEFSIDGTLSGDSNTSVPTEKAVKSYVDASIPTSESLKVTLASGNISDGTDLIMSTGDDLTISAGSTLEIKPTGFFKLNSLQVSDIVNVIDATTNSQDLVTGAAVKNYVTSVLPATESLSATLLVGNTTGGTDIELSTLDTFNVVNSSNVSKTVISRRLGLPSIGNITLMGDTDGALFEVDNVLYSSEGKKRLQFVASGATRFISESTGAFDFENTSGQSIIQFADNGAISIMSPNAVPANSSFSVGGNVIIDNLRNIKNVPVIFNNNSGLQAIDLNNSDALIFDTPDGHSALLLSGGALDTNYYSNETHSFRGISNLDIHAVIDTSGIKSLGNLQLGSSTAVTSILDEDNMASNSSVALATQQSIKAYVDNSAVGFGTLTEVLANGNTTNGNDLIISAADAFTTDSIVETTFNTGVTIEGIINKDGNLGIGTSKVIAFAAGDQAEIQHDSSNFIIENVKGDILVNNKTANSDLKYENSNGIALRIFPNPVDASSSVLDFDGTIETTKLKLGAGTTVNEIITSTALTGASNDELATALAIKTYVDTAISSGGFGSVTSVASTIGGNAISVGGSPITVNGTLAYTFQGTASQYINGAGNLVTFPTDQQGVTSVASTVTGNALTVSGSPVTSTGTLAYAWAGNASEYINGAGNLTTFPTDQQGVTSVGQSHQGNAFTVSGSPVTSTGTLGINVVGTASQYINGAGNLITFPSIPSVGNGTLTIATSGTVSGSGTFTANQSGNTTITITGDAFPSIPTVNNPTITFTAGNKLSGGGAITLNQSNAETVSFALASDNVSQFTNDSGYITAASIPSTESLSATLAVGNTTGSNNILFGANNKAIFNSNFEIYRDASNAIISETGAGSLILRGTNLVLQSDDNDAYIQCIENGGVTLYQQIGGSSAPRLNTTTVGVNVTGTVTWSGGSSGESNTAFDRSITGFSNSGSSSKTLTLTREDGNTLSTNFSIPQGTVTSVTINGNAYSASGSTGVTIAPQGTATQYINGQGNLTTFPSIPSSVTNNNQLINGAGYITSSAVPTNNNQLTNGAGYITSADGGNAATLGGLGLPSSTTNNEANKIVRTQANGYAMFGWINTISGDNNTTTFDKIYASSDNYLRYYTPANFGSQIGQYINYNSLANKPTIPTNNNQLTNGAGYITSAPSVGNGTITLSAGSGLSGGGSFTVNQSGNTTITFTSNSSGTIGGAGTNDFVPLFNGTSSIDNSIMQQTTAGNAKFIQVNGRMNLTGSGGDANGGTLNLTNVNARVGIRTATPEAALDVIGNTKIRNILSVGATTEQYLFVGDSTTTPVGYVKMGRYGDGTDYNSNGSDRVAQFTPAFTDGGKIVEDERYMTFKFTRVQMEALDTTPLLLIAQSSLYSYHVTDAVLYQKNSAGGQAPEMSGGALGQLNIIYEEVASGTRTTRPWAIGKTALNAQDSSNQKRAIYEFFQNQDQGIIGRANSYPKYAVKLGTNGNLWIAGSGTVDYFLRIKVKNINVQKDIENDPELITL